MSTAAAGLRDLIAQVRANPADQTATLLLADAMDWALAELAGVTSADVDLLAELYTVRGVRHFSAAWVLQRARGLTRLREALIDAVGEPLIPRRVGKYLASLQGLDVGGWIVRNDGRDKEGAIWTVKKTCI